MKNQLRKPTKLSLRAETVRQLHQADLDKIAGGGPTSTINHPIPVSAADTSPCKPVIPQ